MLITNIFSIPGLIFKKAQWIILILLLMGGAYLRGPHGRCQAGSAIVPPVSVLENGPSSHVSSVQQAELIALRACQLAEGKPADTYRRLLCSWGGPGFLTSQGQPIKNGKHVADLLDAILLPGALAIQVSFKG